MSDLAHLELLGETTVGDLHDDVSCGGSILASDQTDTLNVVCEGEVRGRLLSFCQVGEVKQDVSWFQVTVNNAFLCDGSNPSHDLTQDDLCL